MKKMTKILIFRIGIFQQITMNWLQRTSKITLWQSWEGNTLITSQERTCSNKSGELRLQLLYIQDVLQCSHQNSLLLGCLPANGLGISLGHFFPNIKPSERTFTG
jgi:hypothetical protein